LPRPPHTREYVQDEKKTPKQVIDAKVLPKKQVAKRRKLVLNQQR
jgi:hypothetical protein